MAAKKQKVGNFISLRFPEDVGTDKVPAYIRFTPQTVIYGGTEGLNPVGKPSLSYGTGVINRNPVGILDQVKKQVGGVVQSFATAAKSAISSVGGIFGSGATFSSSINQLSKIVSGSIRIGDFTISVGQKTKPDQLRSEGSINLYLPEGLVSTAAVSYTGIEGAAIAAGVEAANGDLSLDSLKKVAGGAVSDMVRASGNISGIIAQTPGKVMNNFSFQIFNGVNHRNFEYTFLLTPKNEKEAEEVKRICDTFLFLMLPGRSSEAGVQFYEIPCQWKIEYQYMGNNLEHFQQPNACFLQNVSVQYNAASGNALHTDGSPLQSTLSLSFIEIEPIYRKGDLLDKDIKK
jgi:hypothetical protein